MAGTNGAAGPMGYIGSIEAFGQIIRATSCSISPRQAINHPEVIDGTVDHTLYGLGGIEIDGDIRFPLVTGSGFETTIWNLATNRDLNTGELLSGAAGTVNVRYYHGYGRKFTGCLINSLEFSATAGNQVEGSVNVWATKCEEGSNPAGYAGAPSRIIQWSDVSIEGIGGTDNSTGPNNQASSCIVKEIRISVNNNLARNYTFCADSGLYPNNISTGKRMIEGTLTFQGRAPTESRAINNYLQSSPDTQDVTVNFGQNLAVHFHNVVWEYQHLEAQTGLITSTAKFYPHAQGGGQAISN